MKQFIHVTTDDLDNIVAKPHFPSSLSEEKMIRDYITKGCPHGPLLYCSMGETWTEAPPELVAYAREPYPPFLNGYLFNQYGLPELQKTLREYIPRTHHLPATSFRAGEDFEVAVATHGTRAFMYDFGRLILDTAQKRGETRRPTVIMTLPGWDYYGVYHPLGFNIRYLPLRREANFHPLVSDLESILNSIRANSENEYLALLIINAQQNPTGVNFNEGDVRTLIQSALATEAAILLDDAYFAIHEPQVTPTSALAILADEIKNKSHPLWLGVRSLGKQYCCNGWGLGSAIAHPKTLELLINRYLESRAFIYAGHTQWAMNKWLNDARAEVYLSEINQSLYEKRRMVAQYFSTYLNYPAEAYFVGNCTSYFLFEIPPHFVDRYRKIQLTQNTPVDIEEEYKKEIFAKTGVMISIGSYISTPLAHEFNKPMMRIFLGPKSEVFQLVFERLKQHGFTWN